MTHFSPILDCFLLSLLAQQDLSPLELTQRIPPEVQTAPGITIARATGMIRRGLLQLKNSHYHLLEPGRRLLEDYNRLISLYCEQQLDG